MKLLEQLTVCALIGITAAIAAPTWQAFAAAQELKVDADQSMQFLRSTQSEAKKQAGRTQSALKNCQTEDTCWDALQADLNQKMCSNLVATLIEQPSLLSAYKVQANYVAWEDGSCSLPIIPSGSLTPLVPFVSLTQAQPIVRESFSQPYLVLPAKKEDKTASGDDSPKHRGSSRRELKATKKAPKNTLSPQGCFQDNGVFLIQSRSGYAQVNWTSIPENTTIKIKANLCRMPNKK